MNAAATIEAVPPATVPPGRNGNGGTMPSEDTTGSATVQPHRFSYSLGQAARAVGKAKSTISRDIKSGKISAVRNPDGSVSINPAELHRVYSRVEHLNGSGNGKSNDQQPLEHTAATGFDRREIELLHALTAEKDARIAELVADKEDLRRRLDTATSQLGEALQQVRLLTDQRATPPAPPRRWRIWGRRA
jgi:hypothetical protein